MKLIDTPEATVVHASWQETAALVAQRGGCDCLAVDAPYSSRTHAGHDDGAIAANHAADFAARRGGPVDKDARYALRRAATDTTHRQPLSYAAWTPEDVSDFVRTWSLITRGWIVSLTDHVLAPAWEAALEAAGRYVFAPLACVEPGSRVRLTGDGPSQWACWAVVARPSSSPWNRWGSLPGAYVVPPGHGDRRAESLRVPGGKPLWLMSALVRDYTRPGDLVADPCAGGGTTGVAARTLGRHFIGGDLLEEHAQMTADRVGRAREQLQLWGG